MKKYINILLVLVIAIVYGKIGFNLTKPTAVFQDKIENPVLIEEQNKRIAYDLDLNFRDPFQYKIINKKPVRTPQSKPQIKTKPTQKQPAPSVPDSVQYKNQFPLIYKGSLYNNQKGVFKAIIEYQGELIFLNKGDSLGQIKIKDINDKRLFVVKDKTQWSYEYQN